VAFLVIPENTLIERSSRIHLQLPEGPEVPQAVRQGIFSHPIVLPLTNKQRYLVFTVFLIETLQTALSGADLYYWFATGFGDLNRVTSPYASAFDVPILGSIVSLSVQFFFAYRLWLLGNKENWWLSGAICVVSPPKDLPLRSPYHLRRFPPSMQRRPLWGVSM
jgi:hypothetical protein